jgi:hypothetical protein
MKDRTPARSSQTKSKTATTIQEQAIRPPRLVPGGIYSFADIVFNLGISPHTLRKWVTNRIHKLIPLDLGTKEMFFSGSAVIEFLCSYRHSVNG